MNETSSDFSELGLCESVCRSIRDMKIVSPTEIQTAAIPRVLEGADLLASAKTGSGKTLAFLAPIISRMKSEPQPNSGVRALVLVPTRELALQTKNEADKLASYTHVKSLSVIGGEAFKHQVASLRRNPELLVATPGRLVEHLEKNSTDLNDLEFLVLDEADRMIDMGFAEQMFAIIQACPKARQSLFFSATLGHKGFKNLCSSLQAPERIELAAERGEHESIEQQRILVDDDEHRYKVLLEALKLEIKTKALVFCKTKHQAQKVSNLLRSNKIRADYIHGDLTQSERKQVLNRFRDETFQVLVATDLAARGLDIGGVELVINFTMAHSGDEHVHRVGRTGRAGSKGLAISLVGSSEWNLMSSIERYLRLRFLPRKINGFEANYKGPAKLKKSGKAAASKKRKPTSSGSAKAKSKAKSKQSPKKANAPKDQGFGLIPKKKA